MQRRPIAAKSNPSALAGVLLAATFSILTLLAGPLAVGAQEAEPAQISEDSPFIVFGSFNAVVDGTREPVEGVAVSVATEDGDVVGETTSDDAGQWEVGVPASGAYVVTVDDGTLPDGLILGAPSERTVELNNGRVRVGALFPIETGAGPAEDGSEPSAASSDSGRSGVERFLQLLVEGIRFGLLLGMMAIGLSLIFGTTGLTNFAHAEMVTFGALAAFFFNVTLGLHIIPAAILATISGALAGGLLDWGLFRRLRNRGASLVSQLVITIGLSIFLRYLFLYIFRGDKRSYQQYAVQAGTKFGPVNLTQKDMWTIAICLLVLLAVGLLLQRTRTGRAMRAVSDNRDLASSSGINVQRVILQVWALGGGLAALSGVLFGLSESIAWDMGFKILLLIFAGVTLGGLGTAFGAAVGSLLIGILVMVSTIVIPAELKNVGALLVLILVLVVRPQGILGRSERIG